MGQQVGPYRKPAFDGVDLLRAEVMGAFLREDVGRHVTVQPGPVRLESRAKPAGQGVEVRLALEPGLGSLPQQAHQSETADAGSPAQLHHVRQLVGQDRAHAVVGRPLEPHLRIHLDHVAHRLDEEVPANGEGRAEVVTAGRQGPDLDAAVRQLRKPRRHQFVHHGLGLGKRADLRGGGSDRGVQQPRRGQGDGQAPAAASLPGRHGRAPRVPGTVRQMPRGTGAIRGWERRAGLWPGGTTRSGRPTCRTVGPATTPDVVLKRHDYRCDRTVLSPLPSPY